MNAILRGSLCGLLLHAVALPCVGRASAGDCKAKAVDILRSASGNGYAVFQQVKDKAFFRSWIECGDAQYGLPTAVHESVHMITADTDAYPLIGGDAVERPPEGTTPLAPGTIAGRFQPSLFVATYLRPGAASSATDFRYLLDELNAYTHDLDLALALKDLRDPQVTPSHRDGLAALMSFVALYLEAAEADPAAWRSLKRPDTQAAVSALWAQAERTMIAACRIPNLGREDKAFLTKICATGPQAALERVLGRAPVCPRACLSTGPKTASRN